MSKSLSRGFDLACQCWEAGDLRKAFHLFLKVAKCGDVSSQLNLAHFYYEGLGVKRNRKRGLYWLRKAAMAGYAPAATNIGAIYRSKKQYFKAIKWLQIAGDLGDGGAYYKLAVIYNEIVNDHQIAMEFLQKAISSNFISESNMEDAQHLLNELTT